MRTVVVSGGASWAKDPPRPSKLAAPANDTDARKSRRLWNLCMTLPRVELSQLSLARRNFVDRLASDPWHARVIWQDIELANASQRAIRPLWVTTGHSAMSTQCPICPKADIGGRSRGP